MKFWKESWNFETKEKCMRKNKIETLKKCQSFERNSKKSQDKNSKWWF